MLRKSRSSWEHLTNRLNLVLDQHASSSNWRNMSRATWRNLHDAIFEIEEKLFSIDITISVHVKLTLLVRTTYLKRENERYFYEEWKASTYLAPEAANRSAHSFGSKMQRSYWCFPINILSIFTIELRTKLWSKICIGPIRWIVFLHIFYNDWTWIVAFPIPPHPRNNSNNKDFVFHTTHKINLPFGRDRWNTVQTPMKEDTYFAFIIPSG